MIIETIGYSATYEVVDPFGIHTWFKPSINARIQENDNELECLGTLKKTVDTFFKDSCVEKISSSYSVNNEEQKLLNNELPTIAVDTKKSAIDNMIEAISGSSSLTVLQSFSLIVKNKPELQSIYDETLKKLQNG